MQKREIANRVALLGIAVAGWSIVRPGVARQALADDAAVVTLTVVVRDERGRPAPDALTLAQRMPATQTDRPSPAWAKVLRSDASGVARFPDSMVPRGTKVWAFARRGLDEGAAEAAVVVGETGTTCAVITLVPASRPAAGCGAIFTRLTAGGRPVHDALVDGSYTSVDGAESRSSIPLRTDADGRAALRYMAPGEYRVTLVEADFAPVTFTAAVEAGKALTREVELEPGVTVKGRLFIDERRKGAKLWGIVEGELARARVELAGDSYRVAHLAPGRYTLTVIDERATGGVVACETRHTFSVDGTAGEIPGPDVRIGEGRAITGRILDRNGKPAAGIRIELGPANGGVVATTLTAADGRFQILGVGPGEWQLSGKVIGAESEPRDTGLSFETPEPFFTAVVEVKDEDVATGDRVLSAR